MLQLDFGDRRPLYEQIKDKIKKLIITGVFRENEKIPSVRELASSLAINPNTIQKAYKDLENEGYIYSLKAKGSFVSERHDTASEKDKSSLIDTFCSVVRELKFLETDEEMLKDMIHDIYKEEKL